MAVDERSARSSERCSLHPGSQAVANCEGCGRPLCLWCAVPVRGVAYGAECLGGVLGEEPREEPDDRRPRGPVLVLVAFAVVLASTTLPWTSFGEGSGAFGAWSLTPRWALLAGIGSVVGVVAAVLRVRGNGPERGLDAVLVGAAVVAGLGAVLEWFRPPFPSRPSIVPWIAAFAAGFALIEAARTLLRDRPR